jgi:hypothetical protein
MKKLKPKKKVRLSNVLKKSYHLGGQPGATVPAGTPRTKALEDQIKAASGGRNVNIDDCFGDIEIEAKLAPPQPKKAPPKDSK